MLSSELGFNALVGDFPCCSAGKESSLPAMKETWVRPLGWEDLLEKGKATHSSILENSGIPVSWNSREFLGQRSLAGYNSWDHKESDMTE